MPAVSSSDDDSSLPGDPGKTGAGGGPPGEGCSCGIAGAAGPAGNPAGGVAMAEFHAGDCMGAGAAAGAAAGNPAGGWAGVTMPWLHSISSKFMSAGVPVAAAVGI
jgi:hypothetical protein